ncbi:MAG: hypothetical protein ISS31_01685 [Kiritimatiellae bacterium]|nr:hypothetical protein [Kiritimatiellia bacterium]
MDNLNIQLCPETGICSIIKEDGTKVDLMPTEVTQLREATDGETVKQVLSEVDSGFADGLDAEQAAYVAEKLK